LTRKELHGRSEEIARQAEREIEMRENLQISQQTESAKHTPEPWKANKISRTEHQISGSEKKIAYVFHDRDVARDSGYGTTEYEGNANAARIVACVNHCKDVSTKYLKNESYFSPLASDARLAALERVVAIVVQLKAQNLIIGKWGSRQFQIVDDLDTALADLDSQGGES